MADETFKLSIDISDVSKGLQTVSSGLEGVQKQADRMSKNMTKGVQEVNLSLGEMKRELRELRNTSFMGKSAEEIKQVRARMAELTDQIGDFQKQIREASNERFPALINGLRGVVAGVQGVTATLSLFGVESEKLNKAMMSLINASMALNTVYDL
jgi:DNA-binding phage protein